MCVILFSAMRSACQTLGGNAAFHFLKLPATPALTAMGGVNASYKTDDVGLTANNPALLAATGYGQLQSAFTPFPGGVKGYNLTGAYRVEKQNATLGGNLTFVDYGSLPVTDAAGNASGTFRPVDFVFQVSGAGSYLSRWTYGATLKYIWSVYGGYRSDAVAADVGILYEDSSNGFTAALLAKNMGTQLTTYAGQSEDLPFDVQIGITKKLAKAPFAFSVTASQLHRFDLGYNDTAFNNENGFAGAAGLHKLFNYFTGAAHLYVGKQLEATFGYNHLRRQDLRVDGGANGLAGFSAGLRIKLSGLQVLYARSGYRKGIGFHQVGINVDLTGVKMF